MPAPKVMRPDFPAGYVEAPKTRLRWDAVVDRLVAARNYWLCTVRPDGRPHAVPVWGVWMEAAPDGPAFYFDGSPQTRHARNLAHNPHVAVHLESGDQVVIVEGVARAMAKPASALAAAPARDYGRKYESYIPSPDQWDAGGLYRVTPLSALAWTNFTDDPTKFVFQGQ